MTSTNLAVAVALRHGIRDWEEAKRASDVAFIQVVERSRAGAAALYVMYRDKETVTLDNVEKKCTLGVLGEIMGVHHSLGSVWGRVGRIAALAGECPGFYFAPAPEFSDGTALPEVAVGVDAEGEIIYQRMTSVYTLITNLMGPNKKSGYHLGDGGAAAVDRVIAGAGNSIEKAIKGIVALVKEKRAAVAADAAAERSLDSIAQAASKAVTKVREAVDVDEKVPAKPDAVAKFLAAIVAEVTLVGTLLDIDVPGLAAPAPVAEDDGEAPEIIAA